MIEDSVLSRFYIYMRDIIEQPDPIQPKEVFDARTWSVWAAEELYSRLLGGSNIYPVDDEFEASLMTLTAEDIVDNFIKEMDEYANFSKTEQGRFMFSVAGDEARRIRPYIL